MAPNNNNQNVNNRNQNTINNQPPPTGPPTPTIDINSPNHPLYLHPNDHPGLILISKKLTSSENYSSWKRSMMIALNAKNKLKIVTGELIEPNVDSDERALWERTNDMIISWILNTVSDKIYQLMNDIVALKQQNCSIKVYYHKLKGFWDEHDALEAPYVCNCVCNCENGKNNGDREQRKRLIQFLMGLDECYSNLRGQILLLQPLPTMAKAYSMIRQEEKQREGIIPKPLGSTALSTQSYTPQSNRFNNSYRNTNSQFPNRPQTGRRSTFKVGVYYTNCSKEGHTSDGCYKLKGYPIGHPLHGKYKPPMVKHTSESENRTPKVNLIHEQDNAGSLVQTEASTSGGNSGNDAVFVRMDQL
ncbi:cysteine-rich receptor-like protein kinase 8 [Tanacetum coccineum]